MDELRKKLEAELLSRQRLLDECFGGGRFGGSILRGEMILIREFLKELEALDDLLRIHPIR